MQAYWAVIGRAGIHGHFHILRYFQVGTTLDIYSRVLHTLGLEAVGKPDSVLAKKPGRKKRAAGVV